MDSSGKRPRAKRGNCSMHISFFLKSVKEYYCSNMNFLREGLSASARSAELFLKVIYENCSTYLLVYELLEAILKRLKIVVYLSKSSRSHPEMVEKVVY